MATKIHKRKGKKRTLGRAGKRTKRQILASKKTTPVQVPQDIFWPDRLDHVKAIAMRGLTDDEMAPLMGISESLLASWKAYYPTFAKAIDEGRTTADAQVVAALHANAVGYDYETDEVVRSRRGAEVVTVKKRFLGETQAQKYWLSNRDSRHWNTTQPISVHTPKGESLRVRNESKDEVINSILNLIRPKPDNPE